MIMPSTWKHARSLRFCQSPLQGLAPAPHLLRRQRRQVVGGELQRCNRAVCGCRQQREAVWCPGKVHDALRWIGSLYLTSATENVE